MVVVMAVVVVMVALVGVVVLVMAALVGMVVVALFIQTSNIAHHVFLMEDFRLSKIALHGEPSTLHWVRGNWKIYMDSLKITLVPAIAARHKVWRPDHDL